MDTVHLAVIVAFSSMLTAALLPACTLFLSPAGCFGDAIGMPCLALPRLLAIFALVARLYLAGTAATGRLPSGWIVGSNGNILSEIRKFAAVRERIVAFNNIPGEDLWTTFAPSFSSRESKFLPYSKL